MRGDKLLQSALLLQKLADQDKLVKSGSLIDNSLCLHTVISPTHPPSTFFIPFFLGIYSICNSALECRLMNTFIRPYCILAMVCIVQGSAFPIGENPIHSMIHRI
jgi:hypothetical protein